MSPQSSGNPDMKERFELAKNLYEAKRYKESAAAFSELTSSSDFAARGFYGLGLIQFSLGDRNGAAANFRRVFAHDPTDANSFYFLGLIAEQQGNPNGAQLFYRMALASNPQHVSAKARFDRLQQQQPTNADAHQGGSSPSPVSTTAVDQDARAKWRDWVKSEIGGPDPRIEAATAAALTAIQRQQGPDSAMAAARQAASRWSQDELRRFPQPEHSNVIRGRVKAIQFSHAAVRFTFGRRQAMWKVMTFQLERVTPDGTPLPSVPVELRGKELEGALHNGDIVEVDGPWTHGQVLQVKKVMSAE